MGLSSLGADQTGVAAVVLVEQTKDTNCSSLQRLSKFRPNCLEDDAQFDTGPALDVALKRSRLQVKVCVCVCARVCNVQVGLRSWTWIWIWRFLVVGSARYSKSLFWELRCRTIQNFYGRIASGAQ